MTAIASRSRAGADGAPVTSSTGALALLAFAQLIVAIDAYIVVVASPEIGRALGYSDQTLQTVISAYAVAFGGFLLLGGRATDLLGRRRLFVAGLALYAVGSLAGGFAASAGVLLAARVVQGLGGALLFPATLALITTTFAEGPQRNRALAVWGGAGAAGLVLGVLLGGALTQWFGWEAVFFVNVPLAAIAAVLAFPLLAADEPVEVRRRFDAAGAATATGAITLLVFALVRGPELGWGSATVIASAVGGALLLAAFARIESRSDDPLLPPALLRHRELAVASVIAALFMATFGVLLFFLTQYLQRVHGFDALETGVAFLLPTAVVVAGSSLGGALATRIGVRRTLAGALLVGALGAVLLGLAMSADGRYVDLVPGLVLISVGDGVVYTSMFIAASTGIRDEEQGVASGIASTATQVGAAVGLALLVLVANSGTDGLAGEPLRAAVADGLQTTLLVMAAMIAATALVALALRRPDSAA